MDMDVEGCEAGTRKGAIGKCVAYGERRQEVMRQWSGRSRRRVTCWRSRRTVAEGEARVLVCGLRESEPRLSFARHPAQSVCRRKEGVDEASPRWRRSQWSLRSRGARERIQCDKKEVRARRGSVHLAAGSRGEVREVRRSSRTRRGKHVSESRRCHPGFGQGSAPGRWQPAGQTSFFFPLILGGLTIARNYASIQPGSVVLDK
mgnify:CR=1 FL=1